MLERDKCLEAISKRARDQDGRFLFGVMTAGVYCRPSCPGRPPLSKNVRFYESPRDAERDGLRPCLRCRPLETIAPVRSVERVHELCRYLEQHCDQQIKLQDLAARVGWSRFHLQRSFKAFVGVTPKQYLETLRLKKLKAGLKVAKDVTTAVYDAGYGSSSRVYERVDTRLGMTPLQYRQGGRGVTIRYVAVSVPSPVGLMMIGATDRGICFVQFADSHSSLFNTLKAEYPFAELEEMRKPHPREFQSWVLALTKYLAGGERRTSLPLDIRATAFQMRVWKYLQSIPYGKVQSYGEVAAAIGQPKAARAVAQACARNTVAIVIPCHRVVRGSGDLGGYRWGVARKQSLIHRERSQQEVWSGKGL
jgi:AraC family transcriptional regulator of adaptative response/methylated-DNA-[protein]-cysteine methyltransferase